MASGPIRKQLLAGLDEAFDGRGWHGPTLWGALKSVTPDCAAWRPRPNGHNIWEVAVHAAYWKHIVIRRITGERTRAFWAKGTDWFARPDGEGASWAIDFERLSDTHARLRATIAGLSDAALMANNAVGRHRVDQTVRGIAAHDVYHAGQVQLLKRMWKER